jgi:ABC-type antimicrobial peptide transport system ATPase subunit
VAGDAAITIDPLDIHKIASSIHRVIADANLRKALIAKGIEQANKFSWRKTADEIFAILIGKDRSLNSGK